ncbi:MAG: PHP domain-containing protein, partial [Solirubrobacteraceae bacterium]|nr:PHP domain-containing protein [Solirubrobacteraceae bacterium]
MSAGSVSARWSISSASWPAAGRWSGRCAGATRPATSPGPPSSAPTATGSCGTRRAACAGSATTAGRGGGCSLCRPATAGRSASTTGARSTRWTCAPARRAPSTRAGRTATRATTASSATTSCTSAGGCWGRPRTRTSAAATGARDGVRGTCEHVFALSYVELHAHSAFSFLDGASSPDELVLAALERGHHALALTDHNSLSGAMEFAQAAKAHGLRALHGAEVDVVDAAGEAAGAPSRHLTLLVRDAAGWRSLCRLLTRAHADTRRPGRPGWVGQPSVTLDEVVEHAEGLVCLSGCADRGVRDEPTMRRLLDAFGPDGFRVELQRPFGRHDRARNRGLAALARRLGVPCVATGNVHAHSRERARLQDAFVAIREHTTLDASEPLRRGNHAHVLTTPRAMAARFEDHPEAVVESARLADTLRFDLTEDLGYRYPGSEDPDADRRLAELCAARLEERYPPGHHRRDEAIARVEEELRVIRLLRLSGFFLLHQELLELAREVAAEVRGGAAARSLLPPGRGRGSSVSSIVCYLTGLSHIDPLENALALGRFLNEELTALPDIDLDFPRDVREVLIPRVHERYGRDRSALVAAFPTFRARSAIRELGKALGLPPGEIERVARASEGWGAEGVDRDIAV